MKITPEILRESPSTILNCCHAALLRSGSDAGHSEISELLASIRHAHPSAMRARILTPCTIFRMWNVQETSSMPVTKAEIELPRLIEIVRRGRYP